MEASASQAGERLINPYSAQIIRYQRGDDAFEDDAVTSRPVRLLAFGLSLAAALPAVPALAGWRDMPFYGEEGWGGEFEPPMRAYRPAPFYGDEEPGYDSHSFYPRPWRREPIYGPGAEEPHDVPPRRRGPAIRAPRMIVRVPERPRPALPKPVEPARQPAAAPKPPAAAPNPVREALALPVPRPNLESMDFETGK